MPGIPLQTPRPTGVVSSDPFPVGLFSAQKYAGDAPFDDFFILTATGNGAANIFDGAATLDALGGVGNSGAPSLLLGDRVYFNIFGLGGNDSLTGGSNQDYIDGGSGNDTLNGLGGDDDLFGGSGADLVNGGSGRDEIYGGTGSDLLNGDAGEDLLYGEGGADTLNGGTENDCLFGGAGRDLLNGDAGDDEAFGGAGNDTVNGGAGNDVLDGEGENDVVAGGAGNDTASGGSGNDRVSGDGGNDVLAGNDGNDTVNGGAGDDTINGGAGDDRMNGNGGDDTFVFDGPETGDDVISGFNIAFADEIDVTGIVGLTEIDMVKVNANTAAFRFFVDDVNVGDLVVKGAGVGNAFALDSAYGSDADDMFRVAEGVEINLPSLSIVMVGGDAVFV